MLIAPELSVSCALSHASCSEKKTEETKFPGRNNKCSSSLPLRVQLDFSYPEAIVTMANASHLWPYHGANRKVTGHRWQVEVVEEHRL